MQRVSFLPFSFPVEFDDVLALVGVPDVLRLDFVEYFPVAVGVGEFAGFFQPAFEFEPMPIELVEPFTVTVDIEIAQQPPLHCKGAFHLLAHIERGNPRRNDRGNGAVHPVHHPDRG